MKSEITDYGDLNANEPKYVLRTFVVIDNTNDMIWYDRQLPNYYIFQLLSSQ